jgi:ABC-type glycerol-3-phosphate transport system substrate-binding protein
LKALRTRDAFFLLFFIAVFVTNCQKKSTNKDQITFERTDKSNKVKIKWLAQWYGEGKKETLIHEIVRDFSFQNQNVQIEVEFPHEMAKISPTDIPFNYVVDSIVQMVKQNSWPYDIMLCDADIYNVVGNRLNNLNWGQEYLVDFIKEPWFVNAHKNNLFSTPIYTDKYGGIAPGVYIEGIWKLFYVSSTVENKLGIKVKTNDMTMSDFISYAKSVHEYNKTHSDKVTLYTYPYSFDAFFNQLVLSALEKNSTSNKEDVLLACKRVYDELEKLSQYKPNEKYLTVESPFMLYEDKVLFTFHYSWVYLFWQKNNPEGIKAVRPCEIPSIDGKVAQSYNGIYNSVFVVPKKSKNRKLAEKLMQFMASSETAERWTKYSKCPTGLKIQISYNTFGTDEYSKFGQHIEKKYHGNLDDVNIAGKFLNSNKKIDYQIEKVMNGEISAEMALQNLKEQIFSE